MIKKLGYNKNVGAHPPGMLFLARMKAEKTLPELADPDLRQFDGPIMNQGQAGSCVTFAGGRQLALFWRAHEITTKWVVPSPRFSYPVARLQEWAGQEVTIIPELRDTGCMPALYLQGIANVGFVPWETYPYPTDEETLNDEGAMLNIVNQGVPPDITTQAYDQKGLEYALYDGANSGRMDWVADCLRHRFAPTFGMLVDQAYMNNTGDKVTKIDRANALGGHDQLIIAVTPEGDAIVDGSWGPDFADRGIVLISKDVMNNPNICSDFQIVKGAPLPESIAA